MKPMKVCIFGSRTLAGVKTYKKILEEVERLTNQGISIDYIMIPGGISGVAQEAEQVAKNLGLTTKKYYYKKQGGSPLYLRLIMERTKKMVAEGEIFLVFHDGKSKGTLWDMKQIEKANKSYQYFKVELDDFLGIDLDGVDI